MSVPGSTRTASAPGENDVTTKSNLRPITFTLNTSPRVIARPWRTCAMYSSPPMIRIGSVGARETFSAGRASAFRRPTLSSMPTPAFRRCMPSMRITPRFASSGYPRRTPAAVALAPRIKTTSPSLNSRIFMTSGSIRTLPRPACAAFASAARRSFSRPVAMDVQTPEPSGDADRRPGRRIGSALLELMWTPASGGKRGRSACLLNGHFHGLRFGGWLLLRDPHLEEAVLQGRGREVRLHLFREAEDTLEGLVGPLGVIVVILVLLAGPLRLGPDLDSVLGHGEVDVLFGHARHLRAHDVLGASVNQVDEGLSHRRVGPGPTGEAPAPEPVLEGPPDVVEPSVHVLEPAEGRRGRPREAGLLCSGCRLILALHGDPPPRVSWRNYVYTVLYKICDSTMARNLSSVARSMAA